VRVPLSVWRIHRRIGMSGGLFLNALQRETGASSVPRPSLGCSRSMPSTTCAVPEGGATSRARELLSYLQDHEVPFAIATSGSRVTASSAIALLELPADTVVVTRDLVERAKPTLTCSWLPRACSRSIPARASSSETACGPSGRPAGRLDGVGLLSGGYGEPSSKQPGVPGLRRSADMLGHLRRSACAHHIGVRPISPWHSQNYCDSMIDS